MLNRTGDNDASAWIVLFRLAALYAAVFVAMAIVERWLP